MTFEEAVNALKALAEEGAAVSATVWGVDEDASPLASLGGLLTHVPADPDILDSLQGELRESLAAAETAVVFQVGDWNHTFALWPRRFIAANVDQVNGMSIITRDGRLQIHKNRPWIS